MESFDNYDLTPHFSIYEMCSIKKYGFANAPSFVIKENLIQLCMFLEQLRSALGAPITVNSGYRNDVINARVGGVHSSDHVKGLAADIRVKGFTPIRICKLIHSYPVLNSQVGQIIIYPTFLHVSINRYKHKSEYLIKKGTHYEVYKT